MTSNTIPQTIPQALILTQQRIDEACQVAGRKAHEVLLLAVSKTKP